MPELPEVETVRAYLAAHLVGCRLDQIELRRSDLRYPIPTGAVHALQFMEIVAVRRRAKYLLVDLRSSGGSEQTAIVHLGMSGRLFVEAERPDHWQKHEHWRFDLIQSNAVLYLRYVDARRFGSLDVWATADLARHPLLANLGVEPLENMFSGSYLFDRTRTVRQGIKVAIMDGHSVVGIGNIYASETCFRARVDPRRSAQSLDLTECNDLVDAAKAVLRAAIAAGGSTLRDFIGGDSAPGYFQQQLDVYGRDGQKCQRCSGVVQRLLLGQRATFYCGNCQK